MDTSASSRSLPTILGRVMLSMSLLMAGVCLGVLFGPRQRATPPMDPDLARGVDLMVGAEVERLRDLGLDKALLLLAAPEPDPAPGSLAPILDSMTLPEEGIARELIGLAQAPWLLAGSPVPPRLAQWLETNAQALDAFDSMEAPAFSSLFSLREPVSGDIRLKLQLLAAGLSVDGVSAMADGRHERAADRCRLLLHFLENLRSEAVLPEDSLMACDLMSLGAPGLLALAHGLDAGPFLSGPLAEGSLADKELMRDFRGSLMAEAVVLLSRLPRHTGNAPVALRDDLGLRIDLACALRYTRSLMEAYGQPSPMALAAAATLEMELSAFRDTPLRTTASLFRDSPRRLARAQADSDLIRLALAIARYRADTGTAPESLERLTPDYLDRLPLDPERGATYSYDPEAPGFGLTRPPARDEQPIPQTMDIA